MATVTVNEAMKKLLKAAMYKKLQAESGTLNHTNRDGYYSPSRWWYDRNDTSLGGSILGTSGSMSVTDTGNLEVTVNLDYTLTPR